MKSSSPPRTVSLEKDLIESPLGKKLLTRLPVKIVRDRIPPRDYPAFGPGDLILARHEGRFIKRCPGTKDYNCCGLKIIHFGLGCHLNCTYCILQGYLDTSALVLFGNLDDLLAQVEAEIQIPGPGRFCTGEFTDSLLLEEWTGIGAALVSLFGKSNDKVLELKTKTANVQTLLGLEHNNRTVISFSMNAPAVSNREESGAAPLEARLAAAAEAVRAGYRVGFHFDPIIRHEGWQEGYASTVAAIFDRVPANRIAWISLGAFRYLPSLKASVRERYPESAIMDEEFVLAVDGKMRYLRPLRVELYRHVLERIRAASPNVRVYMCMENRRVWREVFGHDPGGPGLIEMLDARIDASSR